MNIQFKKSDSLYKIFKILKKVPPYKKAIITIDQKHELFEHKWWASQIADLIKEQHLQATFIVHNKEQAQFFQDVGIPIQYKNKQGLAGIWERIKSFVFSSGSIHQQLLAQKNTQSYLILAAEIAVLVLVGIFFW